MEGFTIESFLPNTSLELVSFDAPNGLQGDGTVLFDKPGGDADSRLRTTLTEFKNLSISNNDKYTWYFRFKAFANVDKRIVFFSGAGVETVVESYNIYFEESTADKNWVIQAKMHDGAAGVTDATITFRDNIVDPDDGLIHELFVIRDGDTHTIYVDGALVPAVASSTINIIDDGFISYGSGVYIGNALDPAIGETTYKFLLHDFYFWRRRVLSSSEVLAFIRDTNHLNPHFKFNFNEPSKTSGDTFSFGQTALLTDGIRVDTPENALFDRERSSQGDLQSILQGSKSNITLEMDLIEANQYRAIRKVIHDRTNPAKVFIDFPSDPSQTILFDATTDEIFEESSSNADLNLTGSATEFIAGEYVNINDPDGADISKATTDEFQYFFFRIDLTSFLAARPTDPIKRITLGLKRLHLADNNGDNGILISAFDASRSSWVEIKRQSITIDEDYVLFASIRPIDGFESMDNFIDSQNNVTFRVRNLNTNPDQGTSNVTLKVRYAKAFINAYGVVVTGQDNATYRSTHTTQGYVQTVDFEEL